MPIRLNRDVAATLDRLADLLATEDANQFRVRAYRSAARHVAAWPDDITELWQTGQLMEIRGVGESIAAKIEEFLRTGRVRSLERRRRRRIPPALAGLLKVPGIGPGRARAVYGALGITSVSGLAEAARQGRLRSVRGFSPATEARVLAAVERLEHRARRAPLSVAEPVAKHVAALLRARRGVREVAPVGEIRRRQDMVEAITLLAASDRPEEAIDSFTQLPLVEAVLERHAASATIVVHDALPVELRLVPPDTFGAASLQHTGSPAHWLALRALAARGGLGLSESGLYELSTGRRFPCAVEAQIYAALGLAWIPPELREDRGEIAAARAGRLPRLLEEDDLRGDLHVHTDWSDGDSSLHLMAEVARRRGYDYVAITDHSPGPGVPRGVPVERVLVQRRRIDALNEQLAPFRILHGAEVNIRRDGRLDYPDRLLRLLDFVIAGVHSALDQPTAAMTSRVIAALRHPSVRLLCHPLGRLMGQRDASALDIEAALHVAREEGVALEINAQPLRLDLDDVWARRAKELGVRLALNSDAHSATQLALVRYGVGVARRAWLEPRDVLNTQPLAAVLHHITPAAAA